MILLEVRGVHKRFGRLEVLKGVDLTVKAGEIIGITGENGSGKTTLLQIIVGLLPCDRGEVNVRANFGYCPQTPLIFDDLTWRKTLLIFQRLMGSVGKKG
jgi:ABC-type multidrug transport system ATPase subunit